MTAEPRARDQIGDRHRVRGRRLVVEITHQAQRRRGDRRQDRPAVVSDQAIDRSTQRCCRDARHRRDLPGHRVGDDVRAGQRAEHPFGDVDGLESEIERRQSCRAPLVGLRPVETELRRRGQQRQRRHHAADAERPRTGRSCRRTRCPPDARVGSRSTADQIGDRVGERRERHRARRAASIRRSRAGPTRRRELSRPMRLDSPTSCGSHDSRLPPRPCSSTIVLSWSGGLTSRHANCSQSTSRIAVIAWHRTHRQPSVNSVDNTVDKDRRWTTIIPMHDLPPADSAAFRAHLVGMVRALGPVIAERAVVHDREASFPFDNFADFRDAGSAGRVRSPPSTADWAPRYADYVRVSEEIGRYCGATALTFNMHNATMLWCGEVADLLDHVGRRARPARPDPRGHVRWRGRARRHPQPAVLGGPGAGRHRRRGHPGGTRRRRMAGDRPQDLRVAQRRGHLLQRHLPRARRRARSGCSACRRTPTVSRSSTTGIRWACAARCRAPC